MQIIPAKTPGFVKTLFPSFVWNVSTTEPIIYLTFDDGPTPEITDWVLQTLDSYNAKATFFCIGNNINKHPEIFERILKNKHAIGNHTYNHLKGWKHKTKNYIKDVLLTEAIITSKSLKINSEIESNKKLFRPPYGKFKVKQSKEILKLGYKIVLWDVLSYDWDKSVSNITCLNNITSAAKEGSIIVFHDSIKASYNLKKVLPQVLKHYSAKGFKFKAITL